MAKVNPNHFENDRNYCQGMEDMLNLIRRIFELDTYQRQKYYHESDVAKILCMFDFAQLREIDNMITTEDIKTYYIIRGISGNLGNSKKVVAESLKLKFEPTEDMIRAFLELHDEADFAVVEKIYARK